MGFGRLPWACMGGRPSKPGSIFEGILEQIVGAPALVPVRDRRVRCRSNSRLPATHQPIPNPFTNSTRKFARLTARICFRTAFAVPPSVERTLLQPTLARVTNQESWITHYIRVKVIMSTDSESASSNRVHSSNLRTKSCGKTFGAFEPPFPPIVAELRPWGAGKEHKCPIKRAPAASRAADPCSHHNESGPHLHLIPA